MGTQILGGGVVVLVAVLLWLVYLLPSIYSRSRYDAAERNALRLNRALRVLAETSETPPEMRVELSARQARTQQRLARRAQAEVERLERERAEIRAEQERAARERELSLLGERRRRLEAEAAAREERRLALEAERLERERRIAQRRATAQRAAASRAETVREKVVNPEVVSPEAARSEPRAVPAGAARARRLVRLTATAVLLSALVALVVSVSLLVPAFGNATLPAAPAVSAVLAVVAGSVAVATLRRIARVARRARSEATSAERESVSAPAARPTPALLDPADRGWTPRSLPAPLASTAGSQAAAAASARAAREELRRAAQEEELRGRAEELRPAPVPLPTAPAPSPAAASGPESPYARMGYVDDTEIEEHVRDLLARRAAG